jgi:alanine racemase
VTWRPTWAEIDLEAVRENCRALRARLTPGTSHLAVVKANGYGHGDVAVSRACLEAGVDRLGVALVEEGVRLRAAGIEAPVLVLFEPVSPPAAKEIVAEGLTATVYTRSGADAMSDAALAAGSRRAIHVAVDTGMHREGVPAGEALAFVRHVAKLPGIEIEGIWTHLAVADERDNPETDHQIERFMDLCDAIAADGLEIPMRHVCNSAGAIARPGAHLEMVRTGISVYGLYPAQWMRERVRLRPAMRMVSRVSDVKRVPAGEGISYGLSYAPVSDATIATVPAGYADGVTRLLSNAGEVLIHGRRRRIAGRVTMDQFMVDCGRDDIAAGDEVVLIGEQLQDTITADEIADRIGTINYEVVCAVGARVPRVYQG